MISPFYAALVPDENISQQVIRDLQVAPDAYTPDESTLEVDTLFYIFYNSSEE